MGMDFREIHTGYTENPYIMFCTRTFWLIDLLRIQKQKMSGMVPDKSSAYPGEMN
jgi:hypothetical protein